MRKPFALFDWVEAAETGKGSLEPDPEPQSELPAQTPEVTPEVWKLWRDIVAQLADKLGWDVEERAWLMRQLGRQEPGFLRALLDLARLQSIPVTEDFAFWQLVYPDQYILRVITPEYRAFMVLPRDRPGADLYHLATAKLVVQ